MGGSKTTRPRHTQGAREIIPLHLNLFSNNILVVLLLLWLLITQQINYKWQNKMLYYHHRDNKACYSCSSGPHQWLCIGVCRSRVVMFAAIRLWGPRFKPRPGQKFETRFLLHSHPGGGEGVSPMQGEAIRRRYIKPEYQSYPKAMMCLWQFDFNFLPLCPTFIWLTHTSAQLLRFRLKVLAIELGFYEHSSFYKILIRQPCYCVSG